MIRVRVDRIDVVENDSKPETPIPANKIVITTIGRLIFNDILPEGMPFYNLALSAKGGSRVTQWQAVLGGVMGGRHQAGQAALAGNRERR